MTNLDKLLKEFKDARSAATETIDTNDYQRRLGAPWFFGKPVYAQDLMKIQKANQIKSEWADYTANNSDKLIKIIEVMREALVKASNRNECRSYSCCGSCGPLYEAEDAIEQAEKIAGE